MQKKLKTEKIYILKVILDKMVQQKESVLLNRWLSEFHRDKLYWTRVRLGIADNPEEAKYYQVALKWADAVVVADGEILIVETKLTNPSAAIGQIEIYKKLLKVTPRFKTYWEWPVKLIIVCPILDVATAEICSERGIIYDVWKPEDWD